MFGEQIAPSSRIASPWSVRLSTSASISASTTAPPIPPSHHPFGHDHNPHLLNGSATNDAKDQDHHLPALHLLNMSCDDALSDLSDEDDGFFSLDMDVSIDRQLEDHAPAPAPAPAPTLAQRNGRDTSASPLLNPALRRASETLAYSSSPLQAIGLDPIMASRSRNSPALTPVHNAATNTSAADVDAANASPPSSFGPIAPEVDQKGNLEYKLKILPPSRERFDRLVTQLKWRLLEGGGLAVYEIGVLDDGTLIGLDPDSMKDSLKLLSLMAAEVRAHCHVQRVLALEKVAAPSNGDDTATSVTPPSSSSRLASSESGLSLRALSPTLAEETLQPYILTASDLDQDTRSHLVETGSAGLYRFDIAEQQQLPIPPPLADLDAADSSSATVASVAAVDPTDSAALASVTDNDDEMAVSAQTKRRLLKSTMNGLPASNGASPSRPKKDILQGRDQSAIVYLPSKEEKRILRAAEAEHEAALAAAQQQHDAADRALSHTEAQERKMMAKMTRVADSIQPKTARARARARKSAANASSSTSPSPTPSPAMTAVNVSPSITASATGAYTGYENVMSMFGVLSERAARTLYGRDDSHATGAAEVGIKARLIVEAVVRRHAESEDNYVDFQGTKSKLRLDEGAV
ncbi:uncharacterized protein SPSC_01193 [Sporisorium scitamineum]|uniref:Uncharacterized protein n=1 Tax=Sporisorium scitamineum TaxID=49012 RepID=A0A0F7S5F4_9BASI|nr:hypothetical protein [Sporisorium scitamineum]CDU22563.1 uncharacterized protein SPSC_01193 [Sporisorium scitamineum]